MKTLKTKNPKRGRLFACVLLTACTAVTAGALEPRTASLEVLTFHATRYATTPEKRANKEAAWAVLRERGTNALRFLVENAEVENVGLHVRAFEMVEQTPAEEAIPVLGGLLNSTSAVVRKMAAYFLGQYEREAGDPWSAERAARLDPLGALLEDETTAGAATRTLGKWRAANYAPKVREQLTHSNELRRVVAVNALRDMGDLEAQDLLEDRLADPAFTVRKAAARALKKLAEDSTAEDAR